MNSAENSNDFQADLDRFYGWCVNNRLNVNVYKCTQITFTRHQAYESFNYNIGDQFLTVVSRVKDLRIIYLLLITYE